MREFVRSLLNLETLDWAAEGLRFGFERALPAWAWALIVVGAVVFSLWSYSRLTGPRTGRVALAVVRERALQLEARLAETAERLARAEARAEAAQARADEAWQRVARQLEGPRPEHAGWFRRLLGR